MYPVNETTNEIKSPKTTITASTKEAPKNRMRLAGQNIQHFELLSLALMLWESANGRGRGTPQINCIDNVSRY